MFLLGLSNLLDIFECLEDNFLKIYMKSNVIIFLQFLKLTYYDIYSNVYMLSTVTFSLTFYNFTMEI